MHFYLIHIAPWTLGSVCGCDGASLSRRTRLRKARAIAIEAAARHSRLPSPPAISLPGQRLQLDSVHGVRSARRMVQRHVWHSYNGEDKEGSYEGVEHACA